MAKQTGAARAIIEEPSPAELIESVAGYEGRQAIPLLSVSFPFQVRVPGGGAVACQRLTLGARAQMGGVEYLELDPRCGIIFAVGGGEVQTYAHAACCDAPVLMGAK